MERIKISAAEREAGKKGSNRRLRKEGMIPAVLYGKGEKAANLSVNSKELTRQLKGASGTNVLIDLELTNHKDLVVMLKDFQTDILKHAITHVDFLKINLKEKVTIRVPIHVTGKAIGIEKGGLLEMVNREIEIRCLPTQIPSKIDVDITPLDIGTSIHVKELTLPEGVEVHMPPETTVVAIVAPREEVAAPAPAAEAAAGAVPAAGEAAPAEGEKKAEAKETKKEK